MTEPGGYSIALIDGLSGRRGVRPVRDPPTSVYLSTFRSGAEGAKGVIGNLTCSFGRVSRLVY